MSAHPTSYPPDFWDHVAGQVDVPTDEPVLVSPVAKVVAVAAVVEAVLVRHDARYAGRVRTHLSPVVLQTGAKGRADRRSYMNAPSAGPGVGPVRLAEVGLAADGPVVRGPYDEPGSVGHRVGVTVFHGADRPDGRVNGGAHPDLQDALLAALAAEFYELVGGVDPAAPGLLTALSRAGSLLVAPGARLDDDAARLAARLADGPTAEVDLQGPADVQQGFSEQGAREDDRWELSFSLTIT